MPIGPVLNDDYVAEVLLRDAQMNRTQAGTTTAYLSSRTQRNRRPDAPKPNTAFLRNIIRDTDSHNAALKAREQQESRDRLRQLSDQSTRQKRRRDETDNGRDSNAGKRLKAGEPREREGRWRAALGGLMRDSSRRSAKDGGTKNRGVEEREVRPRRGRSRDAVRSERHDSDQKPRSRSKSPDHRKVDRRRHVSPEASAHVPRSRDEPDQRSRRRTSKWDSASSSDSDGDRDNRSIGPEPPPTTLPRGRGAFKPSGMDSRFRANYDPKLDIEPELDSLDPGGDWDMALEAIKDRAKWQAKGSDRLRAAGFTDEEVRRWERGGVKDADDVRWRKKGEAREWDHGKVVEDV